MKSEKKLILNKLLIAILTITMLFCGIVLITKNSKKTDVYAATHLPSTTEITNNGQILPVKLWQALKRFYVENCNTETSGRIHGDIDNNEPLYFYPDLFKDFNVSTLDLSNKEIDSIHNLGVMDLSSFTKINLSGNEIQYLNDELDEIQNLQELDLSNNSLNEFSYTSLHSNCYGSALTKLDISQNLIETCNLKLIANANIDAKLNKITKQSLTLPDNTNLSINLTHNLIDDPDTTNVNITYGFQNVKDQSAYEIGRKIYLTPTSEISEIKIYSLEADENDEEVTIETLVHTLTSGSYQFPIGYYKLKFTDVETDNPLLQDINVYICPATPTVKMFVNGEELESMQYKLSSPATLKFYGSNENSQIIYQVNNGSYVVLDELEIKKNGIYIIKAYQVINGYQSMPLSIYLTYSEPNTKGWIFVIGGSAILAGMFYLAIKFMPNFIKMRIGGNEDKGEKLD